jgi:hypothetical protein
VLKRFREYAIVLNVAALCWPPLVLASDKQACPNLEQWTLESFERELLMNLTQAKFAQDMAIRLLTRKFDALVSAEVVDQGGPNGLTALTASIPQYGELDRKQKSHLERLQNLQQTLQQIDASKRTTAVDSNVLCKHVGDTKALVRDMMITVEAQLDLIEDRVRHLAAAAHKEDLLEKVEREFNSDIAEDRKKFQHLESCTLSELFSLTPGTRVAPDPAPTEVLSNAGFYSFTLTPKSEFPPFGSIRAVATKQHVLVRLEGSVRAETLEQARTVIRDTKAAFEQRHQCRFEDYSFVAGDMIGSAETKDLEYFGAIGKPNNVNIWRDGKLVTLVVELRTDYLEEILRRRGR